MATKSGKKKPKSKKSEPQKRIDLSQYIDGNKLHPIPKSLLRSRKAAVGVLNAIEEYLGTDIEGGMPDGSLEWDRVHFSTRTLTVAFDLGCLSLEQLQAVLEKIPDYPAIFDLLVPEDLAIPSEFRRSYHDSCFVDLLLFILELHNPRQNHLRRDRRKLDMAMLAGKEYKTTPEPTVATIAWDKHLRDKKSFHEQFGGLHGMVAGHAPYFVFSTATTCPENEFWFLAFDQEYRLDVETSKWFMECIRGNSLDDDEGMGFVEFCTSNNVEMIGVPFYPLPDGYAALGPCHFMVQTPSLQWRNNSYEVFVPSFYRITQLSELRGQDFYELDLALRKGGLAFGAETSKNAPAVDAEAPLSERGRVAAAKAAWRVLKHACKGENRQQIYYMVALLMEPWWSCEQEGNRPPYYSKVLVYHVRPPSATRYEMPKKPLKKTPLSSIVETIDDAIEAGFSLTPAQRYAWDVYCMALQRGALL